jgi:predicted nucleotide-binding protein (sugar kinase/HSP70/actin superfamily)
MVGNFSCGPDSFILKFFKEELGDKPYLHIEIDEHSADAGAITRCEAFLDSIENRRDMPDEDAAVRRTTKMPSLGRRKMYIPPMSDHAFAVAAAFERCGLPAEVLPESDKETVDMGMKYASGKECYPCVVTTGDMVKKALSKDFRPSESAFFMPSGSGPCRFGQYNVFHKNVLESMGLYDVPVFAPNQDDGFYNDLGIVNRDFVKYSWQGLVAVDLLTKCLHETRPYEKEKGETDALYETFLGRICNSVSGMDGRIEDVLSAMKKYFEAIQTYKERKPKIGIIGEIFVRMNRFSNEDLVRKIENLGGEVWLAPMEEWIHYIGHTGLKRAWIKKEYSVIIDSLIKKFYKRRIEHKYAQFFEGYLGTLHEPTTEETIGKASPYVHESFEGETILSIGKAVDLAERGACGVVNSMPFGCMPGTIVSALMRALSKKYDLPSISIPYDGTESSTTEIQLEAFMDQAKTIFTQRR